jgi:hypothetical protein
MNNNNDNDNDKRKRLRRYLTADEIQKLRHHGDRLKELIDNASLPSRKAISSII